MGHEETSLPAMPTQTMAGGAEAGSRGASLGLAADGDAMLRVERVRVMTGVFGRGRVFERR